MADDMVSMRDYTDSRVTELQRQFDRQIAVTDDHLSKMNEIREQLTDQYAQFNRQMTLLLTRAESEATHEVLKTELRRIEEAFNQYATKADVQRIDSRVGEISRWQENWNGRIWALGVAFVVIQILVTVLLKVFNPN